MLGNLLSFQLIKKMGEGSYLNEDRFILERVRRERALGGECVKVKKSKRNTRKPY